MSKALLCAPTLILLLVGAGCGKPASEPEPTANPEVTDVSENDAEMNRAMQQARDTIADFVERLKAPPSPDTIVRLEAQFEGGGNTEYIWLRDVAAADGSFSGTIADAPVDVQDVHEGDHVTVPLDRVTDWMVIEGKRLVAGGYTIRVLRERLSPEERKAYDEEHDLVIE